MKIIVNNFDFDETKSIFFRIDNFDWYNNRISIKF